MYVCVCVCACVRVCVHTCTLYVHAYMHTQNQGHRQELINHTLWRNSNIYIHVYTYMHTCTLYIHTYTEPWTQTRVDASHIVQKFPTQACIEETAKTAPVGSSWTSSELMMYVGFNITRSFETSTLMASERSDSSVPPSCA